MGPYIKSGRKWVELELRVFDVLIYGIPPLFLFSARSFRNEPTFLEHTVFSLSPEQGCYCIKKRKLEKRAKFPGGEGVTTGIRGDGVWLKKSNLTLTFQIKM